MPAPSLHDALSLRASPLASCSVLLQRLSALSHAAVGADTVHLLLSQYVEAVVEATGARRGFIALAEAEAGGLVLVATSGEGWTPSTRRDRLNERNGSGTLTSYVATTGHAARVGRARSVVPDYLPFFEDVHSVLAVPIHLEPEVRVRGVINLESDREDAFSDDDEAFLSAVADMAALRLAMDDLHSREAALVQMGKDLSAVPDPDALLQRVLAITREILRFEDCSLFLLDPPTQRMVLVATRGAALAPEVRKAAYALGEGLTGWVALNGQAVRIRDPKEDARYKGLHREMEEADVGAFLAVPIRSTAGVVGVLRVLRRKSNSPWFPNDFTPADQEVLGTIASLVGAAIDNAHLTARVVQSERMAAGGEMSAMSSHMIGNRVFAIKGDLNELEYVIGKGAGDEPLAQLRREQVTTLVDGMKHGIFRLEEILAEFRDFVRATALSPLPLDLNDVIRGVLDEVFPKRGNVLLETHYSDDPLPIRADPGKLKRAFGEIVENAVTFQELSGGSLVVTTGRLRPEDPLPTPNLTVAHCAGGWAVVTFQDAGPGVPETDKGKIFRPFFTSRNRGMGLGLAIVKGIFEAHHGGIAEIGVLGEGAKFVILLPLQQNE